MQNIARLLFVPLGLFSFSYTSVTRAEEQLPQRKPGLWEIRVGNGKVAGPPPTKQCIDAQTDAEMQAMGTEMSQMCTKRSLRREGDTYIANSECTLGPTKVKSHSETSGDFSSSYTVRVQSTFEPPLMGMKDTNTFMTATWVGPCAAGQAPGDIILSDGMKMNIKSMKDLKMPGRKTK